MLDKLSDDSDPADAAIEEYLKLLDAGVEVDRSAFIASHPEVAKELRSFFGSLSLLQKLAGSGGLADNDGTEMTTRSSAEAANQGLSEDSNDDSRLPWTSLPAMFGRYRVESLLGRGAMGAVYRAHDIQLDRPVALKLSHLPENTALEVRERMLQEARAAAALNDPRICRVYDIGEIGGTRFIAMELIEGRPLADYIRSDRFLPVKTAVVIIRKLALALKSAHDKGVVHRDLKPTNVIINVDHEPIVMDFGLAQRQVVTGEERLTKDGMLLGSPAYMSPEQARADGAPIGPSSDIYSLGVVFFELITGQVPFSGSVMTILSKVLCEEPPSLQSIRPEIDRVLSEVCQKMLAKRPHDRFASMDDVAECLQSWLKSAAKSSQDAVTKADSSTNPDAPAKSASKRSKPSSFSKVESDRNIMMSGNQDDFDGYRKWLGITSKIRPPSHYELLKISLDEDDDEVIQSAAEQRRQYIESKRGLGHDELVSEILMRIDEAEITLLNNELRREYDRQLDLFEKRRKSRKVDPNATTTGFESRPGRSIGEDNGILKTFAGIVAILCVAFAVMAVFSFKVLPWSKQAQQAEPAPVAVSVPAPAPILPPVQAPKLLAGVPAKLVDAVDATDRRIKDIRAGAINIPPEGFQSLFNGMDFTNWTERQPDHWSVENGILKYDGFGTKNKNLVSAKTYGDFELLVDWKIEPGGDSGIYLRSKPQVQIKDDAIGSGGLYNNKTNPNEPRIRADKPAGEWNTFQIVMRGERVNVTLNGQLVVDNVVMENYPNYVESIPSRGTIELQQHTGAVEFRNLFLRELIPSPVKARAVAEATPEGKPARVASKKAIPNDAVEFEGHSYKFYPEVLAWHRAKQRCEELGGYLAIITRASEDQFVAQLAKKKLKSPNRMDGFWLGGTDEVKEGHWKWIDGSDLTFTNWGDEQPNNKGVQEHYLLYWLHGDKWSDQPDKSVQHKAYFICEWDTDLQSSRPE